MNTGLLILISNANLISQGISFVDGKYSDFNTDWYLITGDIIVQTMLINAFTPAIIIFINVIKFKVKIAWDQWESQTEEEGEKEKLHTKKTSI
jgi:hypothetical protein